MSPGHPALIWWILLPYFSATKVFFTSLWFITYFMVVSLAFWFVNKNFLNISVCWWFYCLFLLTQSHSLPYIFVYPVPCPRNYGGWSWKTMENTPVTLTLTYWGSKLSQEELLLSFDMCCEFWAKHYDLISILIASANRQMWTVMKAKPKSPQLPKAKSNRA